MKPTRIRLFLIAALCLSFVMAGCSTSDSDRDYSGMDDAEYLINDYAEQLLRDGADTLTGTIAIEGSDDNYTVTIQQKKVVVNENYENGYYIADRNMTDTYPLSSDLGLLALENDETVVCTPEDFIRKGLGDADTLYTAYLIGDTVEMIQPLDPASLTE